MAPKPGTNRTVGLLWEYERINGHEILLHQPLRLPVRPIAEKFQPIVDEINAIAGDPESRLKE